MKLSTTSSHFVGLRMDGRWRSVGILVLLLCCSVEGGVEDPCSYTVDGFLRSRHPCGVNGTCTLLGTRNAAVPHQFEYVCECDPGYAGSKCNKCDHGLTWRSGCRDMRRESESTGYLEIFSYAGTGMMVFSIGSMAAVFVKSVSADKGMPIAHAEALVAMAGKHAKQTGDSQAFTNNVDRRNARRTGVAVLPGTPARRAFETKPAAEP